VIVNTHTADFFLTFCLVLKLELSIEWQVISSYKIFHFPEDQAEIKALSQYHTVGQRTGLSSYPLM
jgi:hypothetical protein